MFLLADESNSSMGEVLREAILPEGWDIGGVHITPSVISAVVVAALLLLVALVLRIFVIPKFKTIPGKFQAMLEKAVEFFDNMAYSNSPHRHTYLGAFVFAAGIYIFVGIVFELFGWQVNINGEVVTLPAVMSDLNCAVAIALSSFLSILVGAVAVNRVRGLGKVLIDFSLPISMSFRLYGSLLSGLLMSELVYHVAALYCSIIVPALVAVIFTLVHAIMQAYILTLLTSMFYGEKTEKMPKKQRKSKKNKASLSNEAGGATAQ